VLNRHAFTATRDLQGGRTLERGAIPPLGLEVSGAMAPK